MSRLMRGGAHRCCLSISYRSAPDKRGKTRAVVLTITAPTRVHPAEVDLLDAVLPLAVDSSRQLELEETQ